MEDIRVLVVEDDLSAASYLGNQLRELGYTVIDYATSEQEVLAFIENNYLPDLIFMDIFLRGPKNGIDAALEIYKKERIPIIFVSVPESLFLLEEAKFTKTPVFLKKPFKIEDIQKSIKYLEDDAIKQTPEYIEAERLKVLNDYQILETPREGSFDRITKLAATLLDAPIALLSIVDRNRIWFKSKYGFGQKEIPKSPTLFASSFLSEEFYDINVNERVDKQGLINPILAFDAGFEFYASSPLLTHDKFNLGILCVIDKKPRQITEKEKNILDNLAAIIMDEMELRMAARKAYKQQKEFMNIAIHDLKNPLAAILGFSDILKKEKNAKHTQEYSGHIRQSADKMLKIVDGLLQTSLMELNQIKLDPIPLFASEILESVVAGNQIQAFKKGQTLKVHLNADPIINVDPIKMGEALDNLVSNAIKYSPKEKEIEISVKEEFGRAFFEVKDDGPGLSQEEKKRIFHRFSHLSAQPTGEETSTGLGLSISKKLVELHGGVIRVESDGKEKGSTFIIEIPVANEIEQEQLKYEHEHA